jgi:hypothetical protein
MHIGEARFSIDLVVGSEFGRKKLTARWVTGRKNKEKESS